MKTAQGSWPSGSLTVEQQVVKTGSPVSGPWGWSQLPCNDCSQDSALALHSVQFLRETLHLGDVQETETNHRRSTDWSCLPYLSKNSFKKSEERNIAPLPKCVSQSFHSLRFVCWLQELSLNSEGKMSSFAISVSVGGTGPSLGLILVSEPRR